METLEKIVIVASFSFFWIFVMIIVFMLGKKKMEKENKTEKKKPIRADFNNPPIGGSGVKNSHPEITINIIKKSCNTCPFDEECEAYREAFGSSECLHDDYGLAMMDFLRDSRKGKRA